jgi:DNA-binding GntR family transcriptional regulator
MEKQLYHFERELERYSSKPLREAIFHIVKNTIIEGKLLPGDRITEDDLASKCNCSRTPVREALRKLEQEGLLMVKPGIGMEIAPINFDLLKQEFEIREVLEAYAVSKACELITEDGISELEWSTEKMINTLKTNDFIKGTHLNIEFHQRIYSYSGNYFIKKFTDSLWLSMRISFLSIQGEGTVRPFDSTWYKERTNEHLQLIEAFRERDKEKAVQTIKKHVNENYIHHASFMNFL